MSRLEDIVAHAVRRRCFDQVRMLVVERIDGLIIVSGLAKSFYAKQLALEGARTATANSGHELRIDIEVI
jgi:hypothetical protein